MDKIETYKDALVTVASACDYFYRGTAEIRGTIVQCATQIYIEQMRLNQQKGSGEND